MFSPTESGIIKFAEKLFHEVVEKREKDSASNDSDDSVLVDLTDLPISEVY